MELGRRTHLGPYQLIAPLGRGAMGEVFEVRDVRDGRPMALKVLLQIGDLDIQQLRRFRREAAVQQSLDHPNLVAVHGSGEEDGVPYIALELVKGSTLAREIERDAPMSPPRALALFSEILAGLDHLHGQGVTHRDLKPQNVLLTGSGRVKIADFGLARADNQTQLTRASEIVGTVTFMAPEVVGGSDAGSAADLYAAGLILYQMLVGRHPYHGSSLPDWFQKIRDEEPAPPSVFGVQLEPALVELLRGLLAKDPRHRLTIPGARERLGAIGSAVMEVTPCPREGLPVETTVVRATPRIEVQDSLGDLPPGGPLPARPAADPVEDDRLMALAVRGETSAFDDLVRRHQRAAWTIAQAFFGDPALAEDVVQEAFLKVFLHAGHYRPRGHFSAWLRQVVTRRCLDVAKRRKLSVPADIEQLPGGGTSPSLRAARGERRVQVRSALAQLPASQRMAVILRYFEGLPHAQIAALVDSTEKGVERLLSRARKTLLFALRSSVETSG